MRREVFSQEPDGSAPFRLKHVIMSPISASAPQRSRAGTARTHEPCRPAPPDMSICASFSLATRTSAGERSDTSAPQDVQLAWQAVSRMKIGFRSHSPAAAQLVQSVCESVHGCERASSKPGAATLAVGTASSTAAALEPGELMKAGKGATGFSVSSSRHCHSPAGVMTLAFCRRKPTPEKKSVHRFRSAAPPCRSSSTAR